MPVLVQTRDHLGHTRPTDAAARPRHGVGDRRLDPCVGSEVDPQPVRGAVEGIAGTGTELRRIGLPDGMGGRAEESVWVSGDAKGRPVAVGRTVDAVERDQPRPEAGSVKRQK